MSRMKEIRLDKITLNMGCGEAGPKLESAKKLLQKLTGKTVIVTKTHKRTTFGGAKKRPIGAKVTIRGKQATDFLANVIKSMDGKIKSSCFDASGNFSLGVKEYIHLPGVKYEPEIGIMGLDVCVRLTRPGYRVKDRMIRPAKLGRSHVIKPEEAMEWAKKEFKAEIV
jgi:large subunit ribosomal protein L5